MDSAAPRGDQGFVALQVLAATIVVVIAVTTLVALGVPERLGCEVGRAVTATTNPASTPAPCDEPTITARPAAATGAGAGAKADPLARAGGAGALKGRILAATDSVASPAIRDAPTVMLPPEYARCAAAPDDPARTGHPGTAICLAGSDTIAGGNVFTGSDLILRCASATPERTTACGSTDDDPWATLRTGPNDGDVRFCQPLRVERIDPRAPDSPFRVDWACASWAGNLHHCTNTLSSDIITTARSNGLVNYTEPTTWVTDSTYRQTWPTTCDSRTFGTDLLACTPDTTDNTAACDIRGFQGLPPRPATCVYFHPTTGEDPARSHTLGKPLHCRLTTTPGSTSGVAVGAPCPAIVSGPSRTLQSASRNGRMCRISLYLLSSQTIIVGGPHDPQGVISSGWIWTPQTPNGGPTAATLATTVGLLLNSQTALGTDEPYYIPPAWPTIWVTGHLPEGGHVGANGTSFTVIHPEHVGDPGLVAAAMIATHVGPYPVPDWNDPALDNTPLENVVMTAVLPIVAAILANHTAPIPRTALHLPTNGSFTRPGFRDQLAAVTTVMHRLGRKLSGQPRAGGGIIGSQEDRDAVLLDLVDLTMNSDFESMREWYLTVRNEIVDRGIDPALVDDAFRETGGANIVTPTCKPGDKPGAGRPDDPSGPGNSGAGGTGAGGLMTAGCA